MDIQLIKGEFNPNDALELITKMIEVKIKFHESKINTIHQEEDIKIREKKIKNLQSNFWNCFGKICRTKRNHSFW